jgi:hypothetical protein
VTRIRATSSAPWPRASRVAIELLRGKTGMRC